MRVFLCHSSADKPIVYELAKLLVRNQVRPYLDVWEFKGGESLAERIAAAILTESDYLLAVISPNSIQSNWVRQELRYAVDREVSTGTRFVVPVVISDCRLPDVVRGKLYVSYKPGDSDSERALLAALGLNDTLPASIQYLSHLGQWERTGILPEDEFFEHFDMQLGQLAEETNSKKFLFRALVRSYSPKRKWFINVFREDEFLELANDLFADMRLGISERHQAKSDRESTVRLVYHAAADWRSWQAANWLATLLLQETRPHIRAAAAESLLRLAKELIPIRPAESTDAIELARAIIDAAVLVPDFGAAEKVKKSQLEKLFSSAGRLALQNGDLRDRIASIVGGKLSYYPLYALTFWDDEASRAPILDALQTEPSAERVTWLSKLASGQITGRR